MRTAQFDPCLGCHGAPSWSSEHRMRNMAISTSLTKRLGMEHPVILAPMGFVSGGALAAAVCAGGGFGIIGGGYADPDWLEREFALAGNCPVGCGFITWALAKRPATLDLALSHHPAGDHAVVWRCNAVPAQGQKSGSAGDLSDPKPCPSARRTLRGRRHYRCSRDRGQRPRWRTFDPSFGSSGRRHDCEIAT